MIALNRKQRDTPTHTAHRKLHWPDRSTGEEMKLVLYHISLLCFGAMNSSFVFGFFNHATCSDYSRSPTMNTFLQQNTVRMVLVCNCVEGC